MCLSSTARLFVYFKQNSQKNNFGSLAYSWGNGLEYHVSTSYRPKTMAAGFLIPLPVLVLAELFPGFTVTASSPSPFTAVKRAALSRASLNRSTSFCVTPGGKVWGRTGSSVNKYNKLVFLMFLCAYSLLLFFSVLQWTEQGKEIPL